MTLQILPFLQLQNLKELDAQFVGPPTGSRFARFTSGTNQRRFVRFGLHQQFAQALEASKVGLEGFPKPQFSGRPLRRQYPKPKFKTNMGMTSNRYSNTVRKLHHLEATNFETNMLLV